MSRSRTRSTLPVACLLAVVAIAALFLPRALDQTVRAMVRDAVLPGERIALSLEQRYTTWKAKSQAAAESPVDRQELSALTAERDRYRAEARRLSAENLRLKKQTAQGSAGDAPRGTPGDPLFVPELLSARLLGDAESKFWRSGRFVDKGTADNLTEDALVLAGTDPLIDQGRAAGLETGQPVYAGRTVIGKIAAVGRFSSTLLAVTDPRFAGFAQIVRETTDGTVAGAEGILKGHSDTECRLERIDWSEPVAAGDKVFTAESGGTFRERMFYGTVISAERKPGTNEWEIRVQPAALERTTADVQVLRQRMNPSRILAE